MPTKGGTLGETAEEVIAREGKSTTPGYCVACGCHEHKHVITCPTLTGLYVANGVDTPRVPMTEKEKVEADHQTIGSTYNVKMICFTKACERMWSALPADKSDAPKPEMDQLIREADMLHDWLVNGKMPATVTTNRKAMN